MQPLNSLSHLRHVAIAGAVFVCVFGAVASAYAWQYRGRLAPNIWVGSVYVGGLTAEQARQRLQDATDALVTRGLPVTVRDASKEASAIIPLLATINGDGYEDVQFDVDDALATADTVAGHGRFGLRSIRLMWASVHPTHLSMRVAVSDGVLVRMRETFSNFETPGADATFRARWSGYQWKINVIPSREGKILPLEETRGRIAHRLGELSAPSALLVFPVPDRPAIATEQAEVLLDQAQQLLETAPYTIRVTLEDENPREWTVTDTQLAPLIAPIAQNQTVVVAVDREGAHKLLEPIAKDVEIPAVNARFQIEDGRVTEFVESKSGRALDLETATDMVQRGLSQGTKSIELAVVVTEPEITTEEGNSLGIKDVLGVGTSNYRGSPGNRIKNIRNGVRLLNGLLIAPGDEFSLLAALRPFSGANGFLPELVIKGDEIKPEIGGGLCQIGSTTFRAAMNSGLKITQRRNHSLVVTYYNDPSNGNPGTDATIYDPAPDFRFINDTGAYVLFEAVMDEPNTELRFTFWGTSDGRRASYSAPVVSRWIPSGTPRVVETTSLPPGKEQCQSAHPGADASFTYTVVRPDGTIEETVYESHYRPLPKLCLKGVEATPAAPVESPAPAPESPTTTEPISVPDVI